MLQLNNFEIIIAEVADQISADAYKVYTGLLEFIEMFGHDTHSDVATESLVKLEAYLRANFPEVLNQNQAVAVMPQPDFIPVQQFEIEEDYDDETEFEFITDNPIPVAMPSEIIEDATIIAPETQSITEIKTPQMLKISATENPTFMQAVSNVMHNLKKSATDFTESIAPSNNTQVSDISAHYATKNNEDTIEIEIMKTEIPDIFPEQQHIINLIRAVTKNQTVTRELVKEHAGSINRFCKLIQSQSDYMHTMYLQRRTDAELNKQAFNEVYIAPHNWKTIYQLLLKVINYDAVTFEINE